MAKVKVPIPKGGENLLDPAVRAEDVFAGQLQNVQAHVATMVHQMRTPKRTAVALEDLNQAHPLLRGHFALLPAAGEEFPVVQRGAWLADLATLFDQIYGKTEEEITVTVSIKVTLNPVSG